MTYISMSTTIIFVLAQVLAPIGLTERVVSTGLTNATFNYAPDTSVFHQATFARDQYLTSRVCTNRACPGVPVDSEVRIGNDVFFDPAIPDNITECFSSGSGSPEDLRAGSFDIEYRQYAADQPRIGNYSFKFNVTGMYQYISRITSELGYLVREGIVVDTLNGGVGFRNHTVPTTSEPADHVTWSEDLLWISPATSCIQTNWTIYAPLQLAPFTGSIASGLDVNSAVFTYEDHAALYGRYTVDPQGTFRFDQRLADASAELARGFTEAFNLTGDKTTWKIPYDEMQQTGEALSLFGFDTLFSVLIYRPMEPWYLGPEAATTLNKRSNRLHSRQTVDDFLFDAGKRISCSSCCSFYKRVSTSGQLMVNYMYLVIPCKNYSRTTIPSIENPFIACYFVVPPPLALLDTAKPLDGNVSSAQPISICATGLKATIKTVDFEFTSRNEDATLDRLSVENVQPKTYGQDIDKPIWAVEKLAANWTLEEIALQWGIVSEAAKTKFGDNIDTVQSDSLPLPLFLAPNWNGYGWGDSMASTRLPTQPPQ